jgi:hypothetical protein
VGIETGKRDNMKFSEFYEMSVVFAGTVFVYFLMASPYVFFQSSTPGSESFLQNPSLVFPLASVLVLSFFYTVIGVVLLRNKN